MKKKKKLSDYHSVLLDYMDKIFKKQNQKIKF